MLVRFLHPAIIIINSILLLIIQSCTNTEPASPPEIPLADLKASPDTVTISNQSYVLQTYLWRDFMPPTPPDGQPLIAIIRVVETDSAPIPSYLSVEFIWVVYGDSIWASVFSNEQRPQSPAFILERIARNGPKWGPGVEVDVIVGLQTGSSSLLLLRASRQTIYATY